MRRRCAPSRRAAPAGPWAARGRATGPLQPYPGGSGAQQRVGQRGRRAAEASAAGASACIATRGAATQLVPERRCGVPAKNSRASSRRPPGRCNCVRHRHRLAAGCVGGTASHDDAFGAPTSTIEPGGRAAAPAMAASRDASTTWARQIFTTCAVQQAAGAGKGSKARTCAAIASGGRRPIDPSFALLYLVGVGRCPLAGCGCAPPARPAALARKAATSSRPPSCASSSVSAPALHRRPDVDRLGHQDGPGIEAGVHLHDADAGARVAGFDGAHDRRGAAPARQQRGMDVDGAGRVPSARARPRGICSTASGSSRP